MGERKRERLRRLRSRMISSRRKTTEDDESSSIDSVSTRVTRAFTQKKPVNESLRSVYPHGSPPSSTHDHDVQQESELEGELGGRAARRPSLGTLNTQFTVDSSYDSPPGSIYKRTRKKARSLFPHSHGRFYKDISSLERVPTNQSQEGCPHYAGSVMSSATSIVSKTRAVPSRVKLKLKRSMMVVRTHMRRKRGPAPKAMDCTL
ncbi:hypothetical protein Slin15195_G005760 [Septoria linicola]|uniref:Uncharacterized protein n=1 Tax=Septoria linicola TaxID=215465 RepID=A0A9Q9AE21_9PEZI|nr:hypothetical protein Slin15195_G005760 [Septoria linicola]